ncbi:hypothetical protein BACCELL_04213 [Bacteroides cellulosilyticus DSM 14838]|uniref:Uncharacterized protein n=1 Tax=Bacteroides cellulosilyticus DSM 14838 TaxID=537012 RepID=E2NIS7_9BACE|nr:hypothetical protein BACCELL_04213 [Bacteroides cellulosilyticus DSM 14838]
MYGERQHLSGLWHGVDGSACRPGNGKQFACGGGKYCHACAARSEPVGACGAFTGVRAGCQFAEDDDLLADGCVLAGGRGVGVDDTAGIRAGIGLDAVRHSRGVLSGGAVACHSQGAGCVVNHGSLSGVVEFQHQAQGSCGVGGVDGGDACLFVCGESDAGPFFVRGGGDADVGICGYFGTVLHPGAEGDVDIGRGIVSSAACTADVCGDVHQYRCGGFLDA